MSFFDESSATLQEALAFIDACEGSSSHCGSSHPAKHSSAKPKPSYWHRLRQEREQLRRETVTLEATLEHLQIRRLGRVRNRQTRLEREHHHRRHAETTNQQLRALVNQNREALNAMAKLANVATDDGSFVIPVLVGRLSRLEQGATAILDRVGLLRAESFLLRTQSETDARLGSVIESISSSRLFISNEQADISLWKQFTHDLLGAAQSQSGLSSFIEGGFAKSRPAAFAFKGEHFKLKTNMITRRHVQSDSVLYTWVSMTAIPSKNVVFMEEGLIRLRDLSPEAAVVHKRGALMQYWYRVHAEDGDTPHPEPPGSSSMERDQLKECGLRWQTNVSTGYLQSLESMLMDQTETDLGDTRISMVAL